MVIFINSMGDHFRFWMVAMSMELGLSMGRPYTLAIIPLDRQPKALLTPNTTV